MDERKEDTTVMTMDTAREKEDTVVATDERREDTVVATDERREDMMTNLMTMDMHMEARREVSTMDLPERARIQMQEGRIQLL